MFEIKMMIFSVLRRKSPGNEDILIVCTPLSPNTHTLQLAKMFYRMNTILIGKSSNEIHNSNFGSIH